MCTHAAAAEAAAAAAVASRLMGVQQVYYKFEDKRRLFQLIFLLEDLIEVCTPCCTVSCISVARILFRHSCVLLIYLSSKLLKDVNPVFREKVRNV